MTSPLLSVIVPIYNAAPYIGRCACSLMEQSFTEGIEFIFIDDASTDESLIQLANAISGYPHRKSQIRIQTLSVHRGVAAARTIGIQMAQGDYIGWCDADDWVEPSMYQLLFEAAQNADADISTCHYCVHRNKSVAYVKREYLSPPREHIRYLYQCHDTNLLLWNKLIHRTILKTYQIMPEPGINIGEDRSIVVKAFFFSNKLVTVDSFLYHHTTDNPNSLIFNHDKTSRYRLSQDVANTDAVCLFLENQDADSFGLTCQYMRFLTKLGFDKVLGQSREYYNLYRCSHSYILRFSGIPIGLRLKFAILYSNYWIYRLYHVFNNRFRSSLA